MTTPPSSAVFVDMAELIQQSGSGPQWSHESADLDLTVLKWYAGQQVPMHVNDEVDVVLIGVAGAGTVTVQGTESRLAAGQALLIPRGVARAMSCADEPWVYLSVHRRRRGLWPTVKGEPL